MRILYVSHLHPPEGALLENIGGMQRVSMQLVHALKQRDDVTLKTEVLHTSWENVGWRVAGFLGRQLFELPAKVTDFKPDVVLFSSMVTASLAYFLRKQLEVPLVTINHGQDVTLPFKPYQWFVPKVFKSLDGVISVSRATREACIERGMTPSKGVVLPNGFDERSFKEYPDRKAARERLQKLFGMDLENKFMLLTVGRQVKRKGHEWFINNVLPHIKNDVVYVAVGDGPEHETIKEAANRVEPGQKIHIVGRQPDDVLMDAYSAADMFIMPNIPVPGDMEGFGIVLLEANLANTPAVASDLEGIRDVIEQGQNGYRVPHSSADQFAKKVDDVLVNELEDLMKRSRDYVVGRFSWSQVAGRYVEFLQKVNQRFRQEIGGPGLRSGKI